MGRKSRMTPDGQRRESYIPPMQLFTLLANDMLHGTMPSRDQLNASYVGERKVRRNKKSRQKSKMVRRARRKNR